MRAGGRTKGGTMRWTSARLRVAVVCPAISAWSMMAIPPAVGAAPVAVCHLQARMEADAGFSLTEPTETDIRSVAGSIVCAGFVNGREVLAQPVAFTELFRTRPRSTCTHGSGSGSWQFQVPLADGTSMPVSGAQEGGWATPGFWVTGTFNGQTVRVAGVVRSDPEYSNEDCVREPLRHWFDIGQVVVGP